MKHIKTLALIAFFFVVNAVSAQTAKTNWPKLNNVNEVASRINLNVENGNPNAFDFSETLFQQIQQLKASEVPANFKNKKTDDALTQLSTKAEALNKKAKAKGSQAELKQQFAEIQTILASLTEAPKAKK
ncbi:hypothetical protein [Flavobacterium sp.]|uniref:hypothetical protein n=1 Tax=Flavobacterium sp. TaxID=239 RepID=UPI001219FC2C|nr:hypothetical protein [Flavobacterium sp.]RZJ71212.1 MAG: hypothetical protein EOO49_10705 [Flavobacterium sp.]